MTRILFIAVLLSVGACVTAEETPRTISVSGTGSASVAPDRAKLAMSVMIREKSLNSARAQAAEITNRVLAITDKLEIERKHVDSTGVSVNPIYAYNRETGEQSITGYSAIRQITIDIHDLDDLPPAVEGAVSAGVSNVSTPTPYSSKRKEIYRVALDKAAQDARANAEQLAKTLGVTLGPAMYVDTSPMPAPQPHYRMAMQAASVDEVAAASYNAGDSTIQATVNVTFAILD